MRVSQCPLALLNDEIDHEDFAKLFKRSVKRVRRCFARMEVMSLLSSSLIGGIGIGISPGIVEKTHDISCSVPVLNVRFVKRSHSSGESCFFGISGLGIVSRFCMTSSTVLLVMDIVSHKRTVETEKTFTIFQPFSTTEHTEAAFADTECGWRKKPETMI